MADPGSDNKIFSPLDAEHLQSEGLLSPPTSESPVSYPSYTEGRVRRCHKRRLNRSSEEEYAHISIDVSYETPGAQEAFAPIPDELISKETLRYLGLSDAKATEIWSIWGSWPNYGPRRETDPDNDLPQVMFLDFVLAQVDKVQEAWRDDDTEWFACLENCGVHTSLQEAIMNPVYKSLRLSRGCRFWVKDTIEMRYAGLKEIQRASRERDQQIRRGAVRSSGGGNTATGNVAGSSESQSRRSISGMQRQNTPGFSSVYWNSPEAQRDSEAPDHITLYKGIDIGRIPNLFDVNGRLSQIQSLLSMPPTDFSGNRTMFYFTADLSVAEHYAAYAKRRANCEAVAMVVLRIPTAAIDALSDNERLDLFWGDRWRQLVWRSKLNKALPQPLRKYRNVILIRGHISKGDVAKFEALETWEALTNDYVLYSPGRPTDMAQQYVFNGEEEGREFLTEHGRFKAYPISGIDLEALERRFN
ncbi:hypothetical protein GGR57DRAFT_241717 [Xylariaceae sp. FL1272]|nr:hypothetical protein GGR57DRAFT_241717 [Xylariaceae sp. FL1272]